MDLSKLDVVSAANSGSILELLHPVTQEVLEENGEKLTINVVGTDSALYRDALKARARQKLNQKKQTKIDFDEAERKGIELLARCTLGWNGIEDDGEHVTFSFENAVKIYTKYPWIKEQVDSFMADRSNFLKG